MTIPNVWVKSIVYKNQKEIRLDKDDIVVFVGPNNAGKSSTLRELFQLLQTKDHHTSVIDRIEIESIGDSADVKDWLEANSIFSPQGQGCYYSLHAAINVPEIDNYWNNRQRGLGNLTGFFCAQADTLERLQFTKDIENFDSSTTIIHHPAHLLIRYDTLEKKINKAFKEAFGLNLILNRCGGKNLFIHVGNGCSPEAGEDRVSESYIERLEKLPRLDRQGDGMKAFVAMLLSSMARKYSILMLDEPSTFLHPPQSRVLAKQLIQHFSASSSQVFLATHDGEFLRGILDAESSRVKVVRLTRNDMGNTPNILGNDAIKSIWNHSLLRYSNILDGLFYEKVAACESDCDAMFYSAVSDTVFKEKEAQLVNEKKMPLRKPDTMFIHCGGKARLPLLIKSLKSLDVRTVAVTDIDALNSPEVLEKMVQAAGGQWNLVSTAVEKLRNAVNAHLQLEKTLVVKKKIKAKLAELKGDFFSAADKRSISGILNVPKRIQMITLLILVNQVWLPR